MKAITKSLIFLFLFSIPVVDLTAGPTIIRDNRVTDIGTTPWLGRGYSIATNTYQSVCMKNVTITEPTYDFRYQFLQVETKGEETTSTSDTESKSSSKSQRNSWSSSGRSGFFGQNKSSSSTQTGVDELASSVKKTTVINGKTYYNHSMFAKIDLISYYASLDEGKSKLSDASALLLANNDLPGFFSSCGPYYVRSMGREATFVSMFTYRSESSTRDESFEEQLKNEISKFTTTSQSSSRWWGLSSSESSASTSTKDTQEDINKKAFHSKAESYNLMITTRAYGMGKDQKATLISFDMDSFKAAIKDAFLAMQNVYTGKVASIEVVPWVENTEFQSIVKLEEEEVEKSSVSGPTGEKTSTETQTAGTISEQEKKTEKKLLYEKKHTLNQNAEFFMEIERADRNKMNMYYKARMCKKNLDALKQSLGNEDTKNILLVNHKRQTPLSLSDFEKLIDDTYVSKLLLDEKKFMYGEKGDAGAARCIKEIINKGIYKVSYRDIPECQPIYDQMGDIEEDKIESFCMPELAQ
jgi:hypothetical protein